MDREKNLIKFFCQYLNADLRDFQLSSLAVKFDVIHVEPPLEGISDAWLFITAF